MTTIECFFLRPSAFAKETLRVYSSAPESKCSGELGYHNAIVDLGTIPFEISEYDGKELGPIPQDDPRWPETCSCGYEFQDSDYRQHRATRLYFRSDHLALMTTLDEAPPGAMYYADWFDHYKGPDGHCLIVITPGGPWIVDGPSRNNDGSKGNPWTRSGDVPKITVNPSILMEKYHGWLRDGCLVEC